MSIYHTASVFSFFCYTYLLEISGTSLLKDIPAFMLHMQQINTGIAITLATSVLVSAACILRTYALSKQIKFQQDIIAEQQLRLLSLNEIIEQNGQSKADHIGHFVCLVSNYITKFEKLNRSIKRHLAVKNYRDILPCFDDIDVKYERKSLCRDFDKYFLKAFPNFVMEFNAMLKKEDQIWPKRIGQLNTELRIFALMKLGITDCETIAGILEYSANTIYVYKMRIKARLNMPADDTEGVTLFKASFDEAGRYVKSA